MWSKKTLSYLPKAGRGTASLTTTHHASIAGVHPHRPEWARERRAPSGKARSWARGAATIRTSPYTPVALFVFPMLSLFCKHTQQAGREMHDFHHSDPGNRDNRCGRKPGDGITFCRLFSGSLEGCLIPAEMGISGWISRVLGAGGTRGWGSRWTKPVRVGREMRGRESVCTVGSVVWRNFENSVTFFYSKQFCNNVGKLGLGLRRCVCPWM